MTPTASSSKASSGRIPLNKTIRSARMYFSSLRKNDNSSISETLLKILISLLNNTSIPCPTLFDDDGVKPSAFYYDIFSSDLFTVTLFVLRKGYSIPLHNHPRQTVLSKVIYGSLRLLSYDLQQNFGSHFSAKKTQNITLDPSSDPSIVYPKKHNLHSIVALENVAFVDFIYPPYSDERQCLYFCSYLDTNVSDSDELLYLKRYIPSPDMFHLEHYQMKDFEIDENFVYGGSEDGSWIG